jgi:hypothetical protein
MLSGKAKDPVKKKNVSAIAPNRGENHAPLAD